MIPVYIAIGIVALCVLGYWVNRWRLDHWIVVRTTWPYPEGYGTYNRWRNTVADVGFTKEGAEIVCAELNAAKSGGSI